MKYRDLEERLLANTVEVDNGFKIDGVVSPCWEWVGNLDDDGYGRVTMRVEGKHVKLRAHRVSFKLFFDSKLDPEMTLNHKCLVKRCIHPNHLEPMTRVDNSKDRQSRAKAKKLDFERAFARLGMT